MGKIDEAFRKITTRHTGGPKLSAEEGYDFPIANFSDPKNPLAEPYRTLRTNIQRSSRAKSIRTILVAGAVRGEGRTQTVANLAVVLSAVEGNKTLLIDADLRHPRLHDIFDLDGEPGFSELLHGEAAVETVIRPTRIPNLKLIPSGRTVRGSAELFHSPKLTEVIETLKQQFDFLLFDSSPVIPYTDSVVLAGHVEGILLVVQARETRREVVRRAKTLLNQSPEKYMGVVLNRVEYVIPQPIYERL